MQIFVNIRQTVYITNTVLSNFNPQQYIQGTKFYSETSNIIIYFQGLRLQHIECGPEDGGRILLSVGRLLFN